MRHSGGAAEEPREVEVAFMDAHARGESVTVWLDRYPQHARALIDLAMALDAAERPRTVEQGDIVAAASALRATFQEVTGFPLSQPAPGLVARVRAHGLRLSELAQRLRLPTAILVKIDQGYVRIETIPQRLIAQLAATLDCASDAILKGLPAAPRTANAHYYASRAPDPARQESFADALAEADSMDEADRQTWLAVLSDEGLFP